MTTEYTESELQFNSKLVLHLSENDSDNSRWSTDYFITYNHVTCMYELVGRRKSTSSDENYPPFAFTCSKMTHLIEFLDLCIYDEYGFSLTLYNYNNIDETEDLGYEFYESLLDENYIMVEYLALKLRDDKRILRQSLSTLKHMYKYKYEDDYSVVVSDNSSVKQLELSKS